MRLQLTLAATVLCLLSMPSIGEEPSTKPRVIVTTDINNGSGDPDDRQSLCHLMWYANDLDIRLIVPDRFKDSATDACNLVLAAYEKDFNRTGTRFRQLGYPKPDELRSKTLVQSRRSAIQRVIAEAKRDDPRTLWVLAWGSLDFIGSVLKQDASVGKKIRLLSIGTYLRANESGGDGTMRNWNGHGRQPIFDNFPDLWWLEIDWTYNGMFPGAQSVRIKNDLAHYGGNLGRHIKDVIATVSWADNFRAGDTPTVLYMIDPDHELDDPTKASWAGRFVRPFPNDRAKYWIGVTGGHEWNFANPTETWANASLVYQARAKTLADERPEMYEQLLARVKSLYGTEDLEPYEHNDPNLPRYDPATPLVIQAEDAERMGDHQLLKDEQSGERYLDLQNSGAIVWRFVYEGRPKKFEATLRYRAPSGAKKQTLFVNSANLGDVVFSGNGDEWQSYKFSVYLEHGPNSVVIRARESGQQIDSLTISRGE